MRKQKIEKAIGVGRRDFLRGVGAGVGVAGAAALVATHGSGTAQAAEAKPGAAYRETEHVRRFYQLSRF